MTTEDQTPDPLDKEANGLQAGWGGDGPAHRGSPMTVQPITPAMLAEAISREDWHFYTDPDGNILVEPWDYDSSIEGGLVFQVDLEGEDRDLLVVQVQCARRFPLDQMTELLRLVNLHHAEYRWPKVVINSVGDVLELKCEMHLDLSPGIHPRLLHEVVDSAFSHGRGFFLWLAKRLGGEPEPNRLGVHLPELGIGIEALGEPEATPEEAPETGPGWSVRARPAGVRVCRDWRAVGETS